MSAERALSISCDGAQLAAILHPGEAGAKLGLVLVVGGPQYRVGSHRQFVHLARSLAAGGVPVLRFDATGMGDSAGDKRSFERLDSDIRAAVDTLLAQAPGLAGVVLWGLCDGASAALLYAPQDPRVVGLVLVNPWLEDTQAKAKTQLWHYYARRLLSGAFWRKLARGEVAVARTLGEVGQTVAESRNPADAAAGGYQRRMAKAFGQLQRPVLLVLSGQDLTAREFELQFSSRPEWRQGRGNRQLRRVELAQADHTCSSRVWKNQLAEATLGFIRAL